jgi:phosphoglycerate dehydrogenase-like enzyme
MRLWHPPRKIVVLIDSEARLQWFRDAIPASPVKLVGAHNPAEFLVQVRDADAVEGICTPEVINAGRQLRSIQTQGAGVEDCLAIPRVGDGQILLTNMRAVDAQNVAEHALALVLALSRRVGTFINAQQRSTWLAHPLDDMADLQGSTMLIVGLGANGTAIAERAHAFGMHIIATNDNGAAGPSFVDYIGKPDELLKLISRADFVVNAAPLTPKTLGLFNAEMLGEMKATAFFINVGRGRSVVTPDLVKVLNDGEIAGAALDVVDPEPLPPDDPLWKIPNVIITPHVANQSPLRMERSWAVMRENLRRYVRGDRLLSVVDPVKGY